MGWHSVTVTHCRLFERKGMGFSNAECAPSVTPQRCTHFFLMFCFSPKLLQNVYPNDQCFCGNSLSYEWSMDWNESNENFLEQPWACCGLLLALWVLLVSHYPRASRAKKETMNFLIPERICKSQQWLNVWRLKSLFHLHSKMKESIKRTLASPYLPQRMVYNPIPSPIYSKTASSVPVPCTPDGGGILEVPETPLAASVKGRLCIRPE